MHMTSGIDIGSSLMNSRVDDEARRVDRLQRTAYPVPFLIDPDHVGHLQETEMDAVGVDPKGLWIDGIYPRLNLMQRKAKPRGFSYVPRRLMCPEAPSAKPSLAKMRNAPAICSRSHLRSASLVAGRGIWCSRPLTCPSHAVPVLRAETAAVDSTVAVDDIVLA